MEAHITSAAGVPMPRILYGTAWKREDTEALVSTALQLGFRGIDTACQPRHYDEAGVGAALATPPGSSLRRDELYLQTKFTPLEGQDPERVPYDPDTPLARQIAQSCAVSQHNLRTGYLDALVLHSPLATARETRSAWQALEALAQAGAARQLGISNCYHLDDLEALYRAASVKPALVQNRFHAANGYDREIRAFCRAHGLIYQSFWTLTANRHLLEHRVVKMLARHHARTPAQVLFRFLTQQDVVPLTGPRSVQHMREDLAIFEFELSASDAAAIDALL
jgi:diketogulonate reductase-like aldo/keto reductase